MNGDGIGIFFGRFDLHAIPSANPGALHHYELPRGTLLTVDAAAVLLQVPVCFFSFIFQPKNFTLLSAFLPVGKSDELNR